MQFSDRVRTLTPAATLAMSARAGALRAQGRDIISLSVGEPDFNTPDFIGEAAKKAIDEHFTRYTAVGGIAELRGAVAGYFQRFYQTAIAPAQVSITNGGKHGLYNICMALLNHGDEVIIPSPYWVSYPAMVELAGAKPVFARTSSAAGFKLKVSDLEEYVSPKTRMIIFNSPNNPTGACYSQAEADSLAAWCLERNILLLSDEIYDQLVYAPEGLGTFAPWFAKHPENFILVGGASKTFAMTGWRVGYVLAAAELTSMMIRFQGQTTSNVCSVAQKAALAAYTSDFALVEPMRAAFQRRRDLAMARISAWKGVHCPIPEGAFYIFPDVHELYGDRFNNSFSLCEQLLEQAGVALVPGEAFGDDNCIRLAYAVSDELLAEALRRIENYLYK